MTFILGAVAGDEASEFACDYAVIGLTPAGAEQILGRMDFALMLYGRDRSAHEIHFWDDRLTFFQRPLENDIERFLPQDASQYLIDADPIAVSRGLPLGTECQHMVIAVNSPEPEMYWRARGNRAPITMQTASLSAIGDRPSSRRASRSYAIVFAFVIHGTNRTSVTTND
jgi:hypothetical protein